jgi:3-dehydrotetronate 4-kinase
LSENTAQHMARPLAIGSIADDYTGATDLANSLAKAGLRTIQTIGVPREGVVPMDAEAVVVALKSRSIPAADAIRQSLEAYRWLLARGAGHILFKICSTFDSTDAGNIGPVTDALRRETGAGLPLVCPAFPGAARTVYLGHLFVGDRLLSESPLRHHPLNPMHDPDLVRVLKRQSAGDIGLIPVSVVEQGAEAVQARMKLLATEGKSAAIADAITDRHLDILGEAARAEPLSTGGSGLGAGIARSIVRAGIAGAPGANDVEAIAGRSAILAGSCSAATLEQIDVAQEQGIPVLRLDPMRAVADPQATMTMMFEWVGKQPQDRPFLVAASARPDAVAAVQAKFGREEAGRTLEKLLADLSVHLLAHGVRRLVVAGGETSGAVTDALGIEALVIGREIAPGVPTTVALGNPAGPIGLVLKSGNFGARDFFSHALKIMP